MPFAGEAPAHAEIEELEGRAARRLLLEVAETLDLGRQPTATFGQCLTRVEAAKVELVDDRQHEDLEGHDVHLRAAGDDFEAAAVGSHAGDDEVALETEDAQEVDEIGADEAQAREVLQLVAAEREPAQRVELAIDLRQQIGKRIRRRVAADEGVLGLGLRMTMQHRLPHRELVEIRVQQAGDDGLHRRFRRVSPTAVERR